MPEMLADLFESLEPLQLATGFAFTEGPLWDPDGFYYFVDIRRSQQFKIRPGERAELFRENTGGLNGTTFDIDGNLLLCESDNRRITRLRADGSIEVVADRYEGKRFNRPNDIICARDGSIYFTDPGLRVPLSERELPYAGVYRVAPDGALSLVADTEYPNGLAFSPDERTLYVANTRWSQYIHDLEIEDGRLVRRRIFADMSSDMTDGVPDGMKVDTAGRVFCTGPGGVWVFAADGTQIGLLKMPEVTANLTFGGPDLCTLFLTSSTSVYSLRVKTPGLPHPWYGKRGKA